MKPISKEKYIKRRAKRGDKQKARELLGEKRNEYCQKATNNQELRKEAARQCIKHFCKRTLVKEINNVNSYIEPREITINLRNCSIYSDLAGRYYYPYTSKQIKTDLKNVEVEWCMRFVTFKYTIEELRTAAKEVLEELYPYLEFNVSVDIDFEFLNISYSLK